MLVAYVDVSGDNAYGIFPKMETYDKVFYFNDKIYEDKGKARAGGTDFNPIADHIIDNKFDQAHIYSDGYAPLYPEKAKATKSVCEITSYLYGDVTIGETLKLFGPVFVVLNTSLGDIVAELTKIHHPDTSWHNLIYEGKVKVDGQVCKMASTRVFPNSNIEVEWTEK